MKWSSSDAIRASSGFLIMWKNDLYTLLFNFRGEGFLGLCVEMNGKKTYLVNIYASCDNLVRRSTWKKLVDFKNNNSPGSWCV